MRIPVATTISYRSEEYLIGAQRLVLPAPTILKSTDGVNFQSVIYLVNDRGETFRVNGSA